MDADARQRRLPPPVDDRRLGERAGVKVPFDQVLRRAEHVRAILLRVYEGQGSPQDSSFQAPLLQKRSFMRGFAVGLALARMKILWLAAVDTSTASFPSPVHGGEEEEKEEEEIEEPR
jgi:hypothetical protein